MTLRTRTLALVLSTAVVFAAQGVLAQANAGVAVVKVTVNQPQGNGPARAIVVDPTPPPLCYNANPQLCLDGNRNVEIEWDVYGLEQGQVLRIFAKTGGGRGEARGINGSMFRSNYAANANGRMQSGRPNNPNFSNKKTQRWKYRVLVYNDNTGRIIGSVDPLIIVKNGP